MSLQDRTEKKTSIFEEIAKRPETHFNQAISQAICRNRAMVISRHFAEGHLDLAVVPHEMNDHDQTQCRYRLDGDIQKVCNEFGFTCRIAFIPAYIHEIVPNEERKKSIWQWWGND